MPEIHPLDRPVWRALRSGWASLAVGDEQALRIDADHGPFGAAANDSDPAQAALAALLVPPDGELWIVEREPIGAPPGTTVMREATLAQMIAQDIAAVPALADVLTLGEADGAAMRALALLTKPGPFHALTHRLGGFIGIRREGRLVAMAGERMQLDGFTEVSGVCTHPEYRGRGLAKALMAQVARTMLARGETPFLHAYADHAATIAMYERLGFRLRAEMRLMVVARA